MALDGTLGIGCDFGVRGPLVDASDVTDGVLFVGCV
jgi:hypothetical protein